ncbi:hypothetical protein SEA_FRANSOYER_6 [Microbacterium phage Fransoyer]|nr:hypothetical protein SEA_FRANSOYER_6 [Microbacterium phage Fransoyer]
MLDEERVVLEDLDLATPCDASECGIEAAWVWHWSCGCVSLYCQGHHEAGQQLIAREGAFFYCDDVHFRVMRLLQVVPLKGGAS